MPIQLDKLCHFAFSALIVLCAGVLLSPFWSVMTALAIGAAKELIYDKLLHKGDPSWLDFAADTVGVAFGLVVLTLLKG